MSKEENKTIKPSVIELENEIEGWPEDQAKTALLLVKAVIKNDGESIDELYRKLTVGQLKFVDQILSKMEDGK